MKTLKLLLIAAFVMTAGTTMAQTKFGHLNSREILAVMPEMDSVQKKVAAYQAELEEQYQDMMKLYQTKAEEFSKKANDWAEAMQTQKAKEIRSLEENIKDFEGAASQDMEKRNQEWMEPVFKKIRDAISAVGKENGFTYIFDTSNGGILYIDEDNAIDASQLVKNKLGIKEAKK